jgi:methionine-R-sulfoxide reductase
MEVIKKTDEEWKKTLTPDQFKVLRQKATERPFTGEYVDNKKEGVYKCAACGNELFISETKFDSGCGWPSFYAPKDDGKIEFKLDLSLFTKRTEVLCSKCGGHLGLHQLSITRVRREEGQVIKTMCGRFTLTHIYGFSTRFQLMDEMAQLTPRFNIAPTQEHPIIISQSPNQMVMMRWGLVPSWAKDPKIGNRMINARAETVTTKPAFRTSIKRKRCLVPATGFYEWKRLEGGKVPHYVHLKDDSMFAFAGLYDSWLNPQGRRLMTFTIITTTPNAMMSKIHSRMPVILSPEDEGLWLTNVPLQDSELKRIFRPYPARSMEAYEVSKDVNNPRVENEGLAIPSRNVESP